MREREDGFWQALRSALQMLYEDVPYESPDEIDCDD